MTRIHEKISGIEKAEKEQEVFLGRQAEKAQTKWGYGYLPTLHMVLVLVPAVVSSFMLGYLMGRTQGSYKYHRQFQVGQGLAMSNRVYVTVMPERLFDAGTAARELEKAIIEANRQEPPAPAWWQGRLQRRNGPPKEP